MRRAASVTAARTVEGSVRAARERLEAAEARTSRLRPAAGRGAGPRPGRAGREDLAWGGGRGSGAAHRLGGTRTEPKASGG